MVTQISASWLSQNFHSGKSYVKKIFFVNLQCKTEEFELEVVGGYFRDRISLLGQPLTYHRGKLHPK